MSQTDRCQHVNHFASVFLLITIFDSNRPSDSLAEPNNYITLPRGFLIQQLRVAVSVEREDGKLHCLDSREIISKNGGTNCGKRSGKKSLTYNCHLPNSTFNIDLAEELIVDSKMWLLKKEENSGYSNSSS